MVAPMLSAKNVTVHIEHDIVSLRFKAEDGREATLDVAQLAKQLDSEASAILLAWSEDQKKPLLAQNYED
ncbi:MAG: hypothetical protein C0484_16765 [Rhodospirillum sp.]|jgi:hypothetical protein|nr:hypothetical protein [Rhodospirillum sp.]